MHCYIHAQSIDLKLDKPLRRRPKINMTPEKWDYHHKNLTRCWQYCHSLALQATGVHS